MNKTFAHNLKLLLAGRKPTPWVEGLGLPKSLVSRLVKGYVPNDEALRVIQAAENVNVSWLLFDRGPRFIVESFEDRGDYVNEVVTYFWPGNEWQMDLVTDNHRLVVVGRKTESLAYRDTEVTVETTKILTGPVTAQVKEILGEHEHPVRAIVETEYCLSSIINGDRGTYLLSQLFDHPDTSHLTGDELLAYLRQIQTSSDMSRGGRALASIAEMVMSTARKYDSVSIRHQSQLIAQLYQYAADKDFEHDAVNPEMVDVIMAAKAFPT